MLALLLALLLPVEPPPITVDRIELNHVAGRFHQIILWQWRPGDYGYAAEFWCNAEYATRADLIYGYWHITINRHGLPVRVRSRIYMETHTAYDREIRNREWWPVEERCWR